MDYLDAYERVECGARERASKASTNVGAAKEVDPFAEVGRLRGERRTRTSYSSSRPRWSAAVDFAVEDEGRGGEDEDEGRGGEDEDD